MTKVETITAALAEYTGKDTLDIVVHSGSVLLRKRLGYGEGEEWAVTETSRTEDEDVEGFVVFARFNASEGGWIVLQDEIEEVCFTQWPPKHIH